jgi:hypothetical protein
MYDHCGGGVHLVESAQSPEDGILAFGVGQRRTELFQDKIDNGTECGILLREGGSFYQYVLVRVWEPLAIGRSYFIYAAIIVLPEKRTGRRLYHVIPIVVQAQIGVDEIALFHAQVTGNAFDIGGFEAG